jgi:metallo-beta-lactamase family protein
LPSLVKQGFRGEILCTAATRDLAAVMLRDSANIQVSDTLFVNKIRARQGQPPVEPLYGPDDAERTIDRLVGFSYDRPVKVASGITLTFHDAGHILGSAIVALDLREGGKRARLGFTGDLGRRNTPILKDPTVIHDVEYLITESTYADQNHESIAKGEENLAGIINETCRRGGHVIVPAFAVGRTQEIVFSLNRQRRAGALIDVPFYVDSPLALDATDVFRLHPECFDAETTAFLRKSDDPFGFRRLTYIRDVEESKKLNTMKKPFVVVAASGMCEGGRVVHHLKNGIENPNTTVVLVSYQAQNTLGRRLQNRQKIVRIFGEEYHVNARIETLSGFSAHADHDDLLWWVGQVGPSLKHVFAVHGEAQNAETLATDLRKIGIAQVTVPEPGDTVQL